MINMLMTRQEMLRIEVKSLRNNKKEFLNIKRPTIISDKNEESFRQADK